MSSISVIIPVYQASRHLKKHLAALEALQGLVHEFIWVITKSPDSSCRLARTAARKLGGKVIEVPKGLYPAWNAGIAAATGNLIYISTVGDLIRPAGLAALQRVLEATRADVVISPPEFHPATRKNLQAASEWPVLRFAPLLRSYQNQIIPRYTAILMQVLGGANSILGSCASCLFRAAIFKRGFFSADFHHYGDTAWIYRQLPAISLAYHPQAVAQFWMDDAPDPRLVDKSQIFFLMKSLASHLPAAERRAVRLWIHAKKCLDSLRGEKPRSGWWCQPETWVHRWRREKSRRFLMRSLRESVLRIKVKAKHISSGKSLKNIWLIRP